ncbi:MAG: Trp family transcriptional regulator [Sphaerochaetaceae bacterium]|jgi:TrpR family trp operon transcriptional repressor|nr:Trp family transcriptional regulator [Sphaerochaetaceae bacterium]MDD3163128.1 Trp family transcriptional regulator [Sphaerochaetaceae bacterium]MDD4006650.1 Trp family transcriptional regulator [Sphaerochaetaceae bacterium]MDD4396226.1 Trp family transcriptional regulator [Sphaerochaetaceae bacterium]
MDNLDELVQIFAKASDPRTVRKLFEELMTRSELEDMSKRWYLMKELYQGKPQRKIAEEMEISLCRITRGSKILKQDNSEFKKILSSMFDDQYHI